jgi:hypothetical protein
MAFETLDDISAFASGTMEFEWTAALSVETELYQHSPDDVVDYGVEVDFMDLVV